MTWKIGFKKNTTTLFPRIQKISGMSLIFFGCLLLSYGVLKQMNTVLYMLHHREDISGSFLVQTIQNGAVALRWVDPASAQAAISSTFLAEHIRQKEEIVPTYEHHVRTILTYIAHGGSVFTKAVFADSAILTLLQEVAEYPDDLLSLLWTEQEQSYLVVLQNAAEKRPNGGFFGSFAHIKIKWWRLSHVEMLDSYLPDFDRPNTFITGPERLTQFLPEREIYFVWANKVGFTYHDGANIKTLYEKSYPGQKIRGIIFLRTDMFEEILPWFTQQLRERQFVNAASDLIRGEGRRGKKELYLEGSQDYFLRNNNTIVKNLLVHLPRLIEERYINVYLTDISWPFHGFLRRKKLTTRFEENEGYFWESNISFNKSDRFVSKTIECNDVTWTVSLQSTHEIVPLTDLPAWQHTCTITHTLYTPESYVTFIQSMEAKYAITLWTREHHILGLTNQRATRGIIYLPKWITITSLTGNVYEPSIFSTPFANAASYKTSIYWEIPTARITFTMDVSTGSLALSQ